MNRELIELYFEARKELDISSEEERNQIKAFTIRLDEEYKKITPPNQSIPTEFQEKKITPLFIENSCVKKGKKSEQEQHYLQLILEILKDILGDDLVQAERMVKEKQLEKVIEKYVK